MSYQFSEQALDKLCWQIISSRNRFWPAEATATECVDALDDPDSADHAYEVGYHQGMYLAYDDIVADLYMNGVNVIGRANRYTRINRQNGNEFRIESDPNYYLACGAEIRIPESEVYPEIESLEREPYEVAEI